jgi:hypothetical protein
MFRLSVSTGMIGCGHVLGGSNQTTEFSHEFGDESRISITDNLSWNSESGEYMTEVKISHSFGIDGLIAWYEYCHLGAIMICNGENQVISI